MSGPANFLSRLQVALARRSLPAHRILMAADIGHAKSAPEVSPDEIIVARFDGLFAYRFTPAAAYNYVRINKLGRLPPLPVLERSLPYALPVLNRAAARYLNRRDPVLKTRADAIVYQSALSHQEHLTFGGPDPVGKVIARIVNGVPLDVFHPVPATEAPPHAREGALRLAITAQFRVGKRLRDAVRLVGHLRRAHRNVMLHVIGDHDRLVAESLADLDLSACVFHGRVASAALPSLYAAMDVGLSPALLDPCPNSVIEMLACGLPVITTSASGAAELVPSPDLVIPEHHPLDYTEFHNWQRMPQIDVALWAEKVERIVDQRKSWRDRCLDHARRTFDIEVVADRYAEVIRDAWARRSGGTL